MKQQRALGARFDVAFVVPVMLFIKEGRFIRKEYGVKTPNELTVIVDKYILSEE